MANHERGIETRNTLLDTSLALFSQNGYDATSVAQICQDAQVSKGAFYHHFCSKQELFLALMETWLDSVVGLFRTAGNSAKTIPEALEQMADLSGGLFDALEGGFPILLEFWTQASRHPAVWEKAVAPYQRFLTYFTDMVQAGIDEGSFDPSVDPVNAARTLTSVAMGLMLQAIFEPEGAQWQDVTRSGIQLVINGMRSEV
jgi:TetR/AcrR family transcriptional regulator, repressor for uid operon